MNFVKSIVLVILCITLHRERNRNHLLMEFYLLVNGFCFDEWILLNCHVVYESNGLVNGTFFKVAFSLLLSMTWNLWLKIVGTYHSFMLISNSHYISYFPCKQSFGATMYLYFSYSYVVNNSTKKKKLTIWISHPTCYYGCT